MMMAPFLILNLNASPGGTADLCSSGRLSLDEQGMPCGLDSGPFAQVL
jgi:hypothetical protein